MFRFLESHWERTQSEELGGLLGSMSLSICGDGSLGDPAMKEDWDEAVDAILNDIDADQWVDQNGTSGIEGGELFQGFKEG